MGAAGEGGAAEDAAATTLAVNNSSSNSSSGQQQGRSVTTGQKSNSYGFSPVHTCMVKSISLPLALQQPLQQDRW